MEALADPNEETSCSPDDRLDLELDLVDAAAGGDAKLGGGPAMDHPDNNHQVDEGIFADGK